MLTSVLNYPDCTSKKLIFLTTFNRDMNNYRDCITYDRKSNKFSYFDSTTNQWKPLKKRIVQCNTCNEYFVFPLDWEGIVYVPHRRGAAFTSTCLCSNCARHLAVHLSKLENSGNNLVTSRTTLKSTIDRAILEGKYQV